MQVQDDDVGNTNQKKARSRVTGTCYSRLRREWKNRLSSTANRSSKLNYKNKQQVASTTNKTDEQRRKEWIDWFSFHRNNLNLIVPQLPIVENTHPSLLGFKKCIRKGIFGCASIHPIALNSTTITATITAPWEEMEASLPAIEGT